MKFNIQFTAADLDLLGRLLAEHPFKVVAPLIDSINSQLKAQTPPPAQQKGSE